jgi:RNA methyltransferase, TrmH family
VSGGLSERFRAARRNRAYAVLEGFHALKHGVRFGAQLADVVIADETRVAHLILTLAPDVAGALDAAPRTIVERATFDRLFAVPPREPIAAIARRPAGDIAAQLAARPDAPAVFLENPAHLPNIGACVRVAAAADAAAVLVSGSHDPWHAAALRGSAGLHFALPVARVDALAAGSRPIVAFHPEGPPLADAFVPADAVLAFGSERRGLSAALLERADAVVGIPMRRGVSSLSIATAVAIALYTARRPR